MSDAHVPRARSAQERAWIKRGLAGGRLGFLDALLLHSGGVMYVRGPEGRFLLVNQAFEELVGLSAAEIVGLTGHDIFPEAIADAHLVNDRLVMGDGIARTCHEQAQHADGTTREYVTHKFALLDPDGRAYAVGGISNDVTALDAERVMMLAAQHDSEAHFRAIYDNAPIGQIFSDMAGTVTSVNESMAAMLGFRPAEIVGRPVGDFADPDEYQRIREDAAALMASDALRASEVRRFRHRDGQQVTVRVTSALLRDDAGQPRWWVSMVVDLTEEERHRADLGQAQSTGLVSTQRLRLLHSIATAANESVALDALAPQVLDLVCRHFGWPAGALLHWRDACHDVSVVHVVNAASTLQPAWVVELVEGLVGHSGSMSLGDGPEIRTNAFETPGGDIAAVVIVPIPGDPDELRDRRAWLFFADDMRLDPDQREMLSLVALETSRVVEREASQQQLRDGEERFRSVFAASPLPMGLTLGDSGTYCAVNDALCHLLGRSAEQLVGRSATELVHPDDVALTEPAGAAAAAAPNGRHCTEMRLIHSSGAVVTAMVTLTWMNAADGTRNLLAQMEDITARRSAELALQRQADEDSLTGLANRSRLARTLREVVDAGTPCAVLFIDLDEFKIINDTRGHDVGDEVLVEVAQRLRTAVRPSDLVARFGGDEFVVICHATHVGAEELIAGQVAERVKSALCAPIMTQSGTVTTTASIGIAGGSALARSPQELIQRADMAMYHAKQLGKDRRAVYDEQLHETALAYQRTEATLRHALAEGRFVLHYQPIIDLRQSSIVGFEALVRLVDEEGQLVRPDSFIRVAEQSGLIVPMGAWVLQEACRMIADLRRRTGTPLTVAVNVAARQVARPDLLDTVCSALAAAGLAEDALALELTESALLEADDATRIQLTELRDRGVRIGLDDFGTGYSSLTYLQAFPVTHLKVDRSFVSSMTSVAGDLAIVRAVTHLAVDLGLGWIAEGIETEEQRVALTELGSGQGQGFLFSRPIPADQLPGLLVRGVANRLRRGKVG